MVKNVFRDIKVIYSKTKCALMSNKNLQITPILCKTVAFNLNIGSRRSRPVEEKGSITSFENIVVEYRITGQSRKEAKVQ